MPKSICANCLRRECLFLRCLALRGTTQRVLPCSLLRLKLHIVLCTVGRLFGKACEEHNVCLWAVSPSLRSVSPGIILTAVQRW